MTNHAATLVCLNITSPSLGQGLSQRWAVQNMDLNVVENSESPTVQLELQQ